MIFTDQQIWTVCKKIAPIYKLDPYLILAINEQECEHWVGPHDKRVFDVTQYDCGVPRMEPKFYDRYTRDFQYSTVVEALLAMSYGPMQMMGESLRECMNDVKQNYFLWFFASQTSPMKQLLVDPLSPDNVTRAIDYYCATPEVAIDWGCKWFLHYLKMSSDTTAALLRWNGGGNQEYPNEVLERIPRLKAKFV